VGYVYQEYPACRYNGREVKTVNSEAEDTALGPGWFDSPEIAKQAEVQHSQGAPNVEGLEDTPPDTTPVEGKQEVEPAAPEVATQVEEPKVYTVRELNQMKKLAVYAAAESLKLVLPADPDEITKKVLVNMVLEAQGG